MGAAIDEYIFHAGIGKKLEGVFDQWSVCKGKKTLYTTVRIPSCLTMEQSLNAPIHTLGRSRVNGVNLRSYESARTCAGSMSQASTVKSKSPRTDHRL